MRYINGRIVPDYSAPDPSTFTDEERAAHARIYAETGSLIARRMAGLDDEEEESSA